MCIHRLGLDTHLNPPLPPHLHNPPPPHTQRLLHRPARAQSLEHLVLHSAGWTLPGLLAALLGDEDGDGDDGHQGLTLPCLARLELRTAAEPASEHRCGIMDGPDGAVEEEGEEDAEGWGEDEDEEEAADGLVKDPPPRRWPPGQQLAPGIYLQGLPPQGGTGGGTEEGEEGEDSEDDAWAGVRALTPRGPYAPPVTRAMGEGLGRAMRLGRLPALRALGLRRLAVAPAGEVGEGEAEVLAAIVEGGLMAPLEGSGGLRCPCPNLVEIDFGGTFMGQRGALALARAFAARGADPHCRPLAALSLGWWEEEEGPGQQQQQGQPAAAAASATSDGSDGNGGDGGDGVAAEEPLAGLLCNAHCSGSLKSLNLATDIALTAQERASLERWLREGGGAGLEVLCMEAAPPAQTGGLQEGEGEEEEDGDGWGAEEDDGLPGLWPHGAPNGPPNDDGGGGGGANGGANGGGANGGGGGGAPAGGDAEALVQAVGDQLAEALGAEWLAGAFPLPVPVLAPPNNANNAGAPPVFVPLPLAAGDPWDDDNIFLLPPLLRRRRLGDANAVGAALALQARPPRLRVLELRSCRLAGPLLAHVCEGLRSGAWPVLEELRLSLADLGPAEVRVLCNEGLAKMEGRGARLKVLELSGNEVGWCGDGLCIEYVVVVSPPPPLH